MVSVNWQSVSVASLKFSSARPAKLKLQWVNVALLAMRFFV